MRQQMAFVGKAFWDRPADGGEDAAHLLSRRSGPRLWSRIDRDSTSWASKSAVSTPTPTRWRGRDTPGFNGEPLGVLELIIPGNFGVSSRRVGTAG